MQPEPWVSLEDAALHLAVSQDTVHRWIRNRGLPAHKVGRVWRFRMSQVDTWVLDGNAAGDDRGVRSKNAQNGGD